MVKLIQAHRVEYSQHKKTQARERSVDAARGLAEELVGRYDAGEPLTVQEVAHALHMDVRSLNHWHKKIYRESFSDYIESIRLIHAKRLLAAGVSITDTALKMGYSSPSNFARSFRTYFRQTPSEYIKSLN